MSFSPTTAVPADHLERLMERYVAGDPGAFTELYRVAYPPLKAAVTRWSRDPEQVQDVLQTTFLKLHRKKDTYVIGEPLLPWLYVIARRTLLDEQRPLRARLEQATDLTDGALGSTLGRDPVETEIHVRDALERLPEQYRDAIQMTKLVGLNGQEAASLLNTTAAAIKQRVHRGYALLRAWFEPGLGSTPATA